MGTTHCQPLMCASSSASAFGCGNTRSSRHISTMHSAIRVSSPSRSRISVYIAKADSSRSWPVGESNPCLFLEREVSCPLAEQAFLISWQPHRGSNPLPNFESIPSYPLDEWD